MSFNAKDGIIEVETVPQEHDVRLGHTDVDNTKDSEAQQTMGRWIEQLSRLHKSGARDLDLVHAATNVVVAYCTGKIADLEGAEDSHEKVSWLDLREDVAIMGRMVANLAKATR